MKAKIHVEASSCEEFRHQLLHWLDEQIAEPWYNDGKSPRNNLQRHGRYVAQETLRRVREFWRDVIIDNPDSSHRRHLMDITSTSNPFIYLAEALACRGDDMEDLARDLANAFKAVASEGLGTDDTDTITKEFRLLAFNEGNADHRHENGDKEEGAT